MTAPDVATAEGPDAIWLGPKCQEVGGDGRQWCEDDIWDGKCEDCEHKSVRYVRADLHDAAQARIAELERELAEARAALQDIAVWQRKPWTDMADPVEDQLRDSRHALKMACLHAQKALPAPPTAATPAAPASAGEPQR